jgi:hypothetical protein
MSEYAHARAALDPLGTVYLDDGTRLLRIALALSDDPDCDPPTTLLDPVCALHSTHARELAQTLLELADHAERQSRRSR